MYCMLFIDLLFYEYASLFILDRCSKQNKALPKDICALISGICEYLILPGKREFESVVNVKNSKIGRLCWIIHVGTV